MTTNETSMNRPLASKLVLLAIGLISACMALADERDDKIKALEQRLEAYDEKIRRLEDRLGIEERKESALAKAGPTVSVGASGFMMQSADTNFVLKLKGILQVDSRSYFDDGGIKNNDEFLIRRARPILEGRVFRDFDFRLQLDFGGSGSPTLRDAYLNYRYDDELQLRLGKFKPPIGLEQLRSDSSTLFMERSLVSDITPGRDVGVQFHGSTWDGLVNYSAGIFNGLGDGRESTNVDTDDEKSFAARLFVFPFQRAAVNALTKLGMGVGSSFARPEGAASLPSGNGFMTEARQQFFTYRGSTIADGDHWRISPQASWYYGSWSAIAEYVISSQELRRTDTGILRTLHNSAWQVAAGYVLTGEEASERGVIPRKPFDPHLGSWGALEVVARYSLLDVDNDAFPTFADPDKSASRAMAWVVGFNWYLNKNVQAAVNYFHTDFHGGRGSAVTAQDENAFFTRLQLAF
jgi:phosphate-selective porin OprO and OprP